MALGLCFDGIANSFGQVIELEQRLVPVQHEQAPDQ